MILIGHELISSEPFYKVASVEEIAKTPSNAVVLFEFEPALSAYCVEQKVTFALHVRHIKELIFANALGASYFVVDKSLALHAQKIADDYLFDGKVLLLSSDENEIEFTASHAIDGILFETGITSL
ncbi:hypothetical protein [Sulfurospirillum multivorans]|uniref:Uncharacterized protein n=2 Tax=Sulfurospirillum multivorans TaxID=66821 RepID=A0AA86ALQ8_SULMK|nr:hypothetical protein [Sulfurospirillum multivorans]AHJ11801.1 hypothetical protein SMUL_0526 [Sulfurospirillum multivorans DSM 12446]QEH05307.1 hypothetical protein SMN_0524 [Sulfurospirillum multivorans]